MTDSPSPDRKKWQLFLIVAALSLIADQATKIWARGLPVEPPGCDIPTGIVEGKCIAQPVGVIDSFWHWRLSMNPGSAFGLFSSHGGARVLLSIVGIAAVVGMLWMLRKGRPDQKVLHWALALVAGGAIGNLIDRIYYGVVTDFILWHVGDYDAHRLRWEHEWPVFNVADIVLVVGVGLMFIDIQKEGRREKALKAGRQSKAKAAGLIKDFSGK
jgi:signal peptidase II